MRTELEKTFRHRAWFIGGQKTRAEALDYFAQSGDFYTIAKRFYSMTGSTQNETPPIYTLKYSGKERGSYKMTETEYNYFEERREYWKKETARKNEDTLNEPVNFNEEVGKLVMGSSLFTAWTSQGHIDDWTKHGNEPDKIEYWKNRKSMQEENLQILKAHLDTSGETVKTRRDFNQFVNEVEKSIEQKHGKTIREIACGS